MEYVRKLESLVLTLRNERHRRNWSLFMFGLAAGAGVTFLVIRYVH